MLKALVCLAVVIGAQSLATADTYLNTAAPKQGWHFYQDPKPPEPPQDEEPAPPTPAVVVGPAATKENPCATKDSWSAKCGFVDPGDDFDFQAKQRDILLQQMSMQPDVPEAVEAAQRYMKWVVRKASQVANMWYFNRIQNPDLDPTVSSPISDVGIALATRAKDATRNAYFSLIRDEGGLLFFFSRDDCQYCHEQAPYTRRVAHEMGLRVINVPLDGKCLAGFVGDDCANNIPLEQVAVLKISIVPSLFLYVPQNTWIRLGTGLVSDQVVLANTVNFFSAYRAALVKGLDNGNGVRPSVTFDPEHNPQPTGVVAADGAASPAQPSRAQILEMMGYKK